MIVPQAESNRQPTVEGNRPTAPCLRVAVVICTAYPCCRSDRLSYTATVELYEIESMLLCGSALMRFGVRFFPALGTHHLSTSPMYLV